MHNFNNKRQKTQIIETREQGTGNSPYGETATIQGTRRDNKNAQTPLAEQYEYNQTMTKQKWLKQKGLNTQRNQ